VSARDKSQTKLNFKERKLDFTREKQKSSTLFSAQTPHTHAKMKSWFGDLRREGLATHGNACYGKISENSLLSNSKHSFNLVQEFTKAINQGPADPLEIAIFLTNLRDSDNSHQVWVSLGDVVPGDEKGTKDFLFRFGLIVFSSSELSDQGIARLKKLLLKLKRSVLKKPDRPNSNIHLDVEFVIRKDNRLKEYICNHCIGPLFPGERFWFKIFRSLRR
jgi:hypothetical protein